jgi:hypothetical protein
MGMIYIITHIVMAICTIGVLYLSLEPEGEIGEEIKPSETTGFYTHGPKLIKVIRTTGYMIGAGILILLKIISNLLFNIN